MKVWNINMTLLSDLTCYLLIFECSNQCMVVVYRRHREGFLVQPPASLPLNNQGHRPPIDLWGAVKSSQQGNRAHSFFIRVAESWEFNLFQSDSIKLGDKLIPVLRTFQCVDWHHQGTCTIVFVISQMQMDYKPRLLHISPESQSIPPQVCLVCKTWINQ